MLKWLQRGLRLELSDLDEILDKIALSMADKTTVNELLEYTAESLAARTTSHPDYSLLAGRVEAVKLQKMVSNSFSDSMSKLYYNYHPKTNKHTPSVSKQVYDVAMKNRDVLDTAVESERDLTISYFGIKTLERSYLIKVNEIPTETPQYLFMRVALGIHGGDVEDAIETYNLMSKKYIMHASPTLFSAGTDYNFLSSCFLLAMEDDSIDGIYKTLHKAALISKASGGIGLHIHNVRARGSLVSTSGGKSSGLVPMLRVFNDTARYVDQGGNKRPGAFAVFLEPWHTDVFEVLDLRKNYGKEELRARDLFYGLWIPDLFMQKVKDDEDWCLFSPDVSPGLSDCYGDEFKALYEKYERAGDAVRVVKAQKLWQSILESQTETGGPYMMYKDACNTKSNQKNLGTIKSSNLCCEIVEYSSKEETAVCNLGSLALPSFVNEDKDSISFNFMKLHEVTKVLGKNLDKIVDITRYPDEGAETSNRKHRPIAIGVQGLADVFALLRIPFESKEAKKLNIQIFETIYHAAVEGSIELAKKHGAYETFKGSPASQGMLQFDFWNHKPSDLFDDWNDLKENMMVYGLRNSLLVGPMPTASTSQILGFNECFEPFTSNIYSRRVTSGEFQVVNKYLINDLIELGLWNQDLKDKILLAEGSVQGIPEIPVEIKELYKTVWEISQKVILEMAADRGRFVDQSQSMNIYMKNPTYSKLTSCHFYSWKLGLKTGMYYLRTQAASRAIQFTIERTNDKVSTPAYELSPLRRKRYVETSGTIETTPAKRIKYESITPISSVMTPKKEDDVDIYDETIRYCKIDDSNPCDSCSG
ncbi:ribonucleoside-diphosphate reductase large chain [Yamadazyma tenuis]|uniref:Ribonucleoside-diphosphate reductase n=1 Tax=Candida tenuis (strain ATCC 10573 / BCRC 21748 / CBS 615 / JCM 9827 / NBRC 10315 / NRRL Y-1498 / VKM Y-70) TaxID=590646 RepID=G3B8K9_CANTC|nr:ribonucleoside-diphosphate reductase large chain [Yamadazyma tenuis ATCC 10573]EGV61759.1 ribonucleoside-diphosphate reductase large chain [Yamadazyma tenuis ATCC 10573]WEJ92988.1 ribonucleoside-diphosphate reductase large chain [Yamadazyma tenuis]